MSLEAADQKQIEQLIAGNKVVLFMKGTPQMPQCGFSATVVEILNDIVSDYDTVNVLADQNIRENIKVFSNWPTIPQLYVDGEFLGGCDIVKEMNASGELQTALGVDLSSVKAPTIEVSDSAAKAILGAASEHTTGDEEAYLHLSVNTKFEPALEFGPAHGGKLQFEVNGIKFCVSPGGVARMDGMSIDFVEGAGGGFKIDNPNAPKPVNQMSVQELKALIDSGDDFHFYDARGEDERQIATIPGAEQLTQEVAQEIQALPKDAKLVFHCKMGGRSQQAAEYFRQMGFSNVHNVVGGINAWSAEIDPSVPQY
ncbi:MAG: monothiol glutaredoxin, Grx4 family [Myxococcales bacterium]|nr:monothiol glutaredoxin, Grx4 family [Myxococcales bacterium]